MRNAPRNYCDAMRRVQGAQLLDHEKPEDHSGPDRVEEVLQALPEAHAAQGSEVTPFGRPVRRHRQEARLLRAG